MSKNLAVPALPVASVTRTLSRVLCTFATIVGLFVVSSIMSPRPAMAEDVHNQYRIHVEIYRADESTSKTTDWIHPSAIREFTVEDLRWHVYSVLGTDDVVDIIEASGLTGAHPSNGSQEDIQLSGGKGRVRFSSALLGTLKVSDGEHGSGSIVSEIGPVGEVTTTNPRIFAERIHLSATPDAGYEFDSWEFLSDSFGLSFDSFHDPNTWLNTGVMSRNINVMPTFKLLPTQPVTVTDDGHGTGSASLAEAWDGATVTLSATPSDGWEFDKWEPVSPVDLIIDGDSFVMGSEPVTVRATFKETTIPVPADSASEDGNPTEGSATEEPVAGFSDQGKDGTDNLPATGDATVPVAIGIVFVMGIGIFVIMHRKR